MRPGLTLDSGEFVPADDLNAALVAAQQPAPSGAGPCVICGSDEPFTGTCGSADPRALCKQPAPSAAPAFQQRVQPWLLECFGAAIAADRVERNHRFLEESLELVQALGCTASEAHQLVDYVFGRPVGDPPQEVGGVMVTLAALCLANGLDMHDAGEVELARISAPELVAKIRAKQAAKPKHSPLPQATTPQPAPATQQAGEGWGPGKPITEAMHVAAVKVLHRASGLDGLPQRMLNAMLAAASTPAAQAAESVPAVGREQERIVFKDAHRHLELDEVPDAWGRPMFKHSHVEASWLGWIARASHGQALRLLTQKEKDSLGRRAEGMDGNEWDQWVQEKFAQVNGLRVQGGSYEWDWE